jgi:hypothetical protein
MGKCGFGKVVVNTVFDGTRPFGTDLEGRFVYLEDGVRRWLLAAFDFSYMFRRTSLTFRRAVAGATGIPVKSIWVHELQNHSAPIALDLDGEPCDRLIDISLPVIRRMIDQAREAELSYIVADFGDRYNFNREKYIPGLGTVTVWHGCEFDEQGRPYCADASAMVLAGWSPDLPAFKERVYFDAPADPQGALLVFRSPNGDILGTLCRFTGHADIVDACTYDMGCRETSDSHYHFDWPGYIRQTVDEQLGGVNVCVCGPCGNVSTKKRRIPGYQAGDRQAREIGSAVAGEMIHQWKATSPNWAPVRLGKMMSEEVDLPLRDTIPHSHSDMNDLKQIAEEKEQAFKDAMAKGEPAYQIKQKIDACYHWSCVDKIVDRWVGLSDQELRERRVTVELEALKLNDLILAGLPGESMTETCQWLRAQSCGRHLIVLDQVNGYCAYQTTTEQYDQGGYSFWCSCLARTSERITRTCALNLIRAVGSIQPVEGR